jgi:hypothetical protein
VQGTVEQLKSVETQQLASKLDGQVQASHYYRSFASFHDDVSGGAAARHRYRQL